MHMVQRKSAARFATPPLPGASATPPLDEAGRQAAPRILFIDSDETYRSAMAACLRTEGFDVVEFADPQAALDRLGDSWNADSALIDADMYRLSVSSLHDRLRRSEAKVPIAVLATRRENGNEEEALELGAADYIEKTSTPTVVALRLKLLIEGVRVARLSDAVSTEASLEVGPLTLRLDSCRALWRGEEAPLTVAQFKIVRLLAREPGRGFSFREIYDVVHGINFSAGDGPDGFRMNVRSLIRKIRARFRSLERDFDEIENVAGYGYRWRPPVSQDSPAAAAPAGMEAMAHRIGGGTE